MQYVNSTKEFRNCECIMPSAIIFVRIRVSGFGKYLFLVFCLSFYFVRVNGESEFLNLSDSVSDSDVW